MSFLKSIAELADVLGLLNLGQNISQNKQLKLLKVVLQNQLEIMNKLNELETKKENRNDE